MNIPRNNGTDCKSTLSDLQQVVFMNLLINQKLITIHLGIKWTLNDTKENLFTSFDLGGHLGQVEKFGVF